MNKTNCVWWIGLGAGLLFLGFLLAAQYALSQEFIWNILNGTIAGIPYRYILIAVLVYVLSGGSLYTRRQSLQH